MDELLKIIDETININNPEFEKSTRVHDWRNHVPSDFKDKWSELTSRERRIICYLAEDAAEHEHWD